MFTLHLFCVKMVYMDAYYIQNVFIEVEEMKIAIVGSRSLINVSIDPYIPKDTKEIVSGGAKGIDSLAAKYANEKKLKLTEFLPLYEKYGRAAPIVRNKEIVNYADKVIVFWDGSSKGAASVIRYAKEIKKVTEVILINQKKDEQ